MSSHPRRTLSRTLSALASVGALALAGLFSGGLGAASARTVKAQNMVSENWAGYVVHSSAKRGFSSVSGSWVVPAVKSSSSDGYSAFWVGLGGSTGQSQSLEQVGTSSDLVNGQAEYTAWYELVPASQVALRITVHAGDHISARVAVQGASVTVALSDTTTGQSVTKVLAMSNPDTSSAEWIAEAPSASLAGGNYQTLPLADFAKVSFTHASATADGHTGSISDPAWTVQNERLSSVTSQARFMGGGPAGFTSAGPGSVGGQTALGAMTSALSADGASFSVSTSVSAGTPTSVTASATPPGGYPSPDGPPGGPGYGYGYGY